VRQRESPRDSKRVTATASEPGTEEKERERNRNSESGRLTRRARARERLGVRKRVRETDNECVRALTSDTHTVAQAPMPVQSKEMPPNPTKGILRRLPAPSSATITAAAADAEAAKANETNETRETVDRNCSVAVAVAVGSAATGLRRTEADSEMRCSRLIEHKCDEREQAFAQASQISGDKLLANDDSQAGKGSQGREEHVEDQGERGDEEGEGARKIRWCLTLATFDRICSEPASPPFLRRSVSDECLKIANASMCLRGCVGENEGRRE
jgi:hypothetical protein